MKFVIISFLKIHCEKYFFWELMKMDAIGGEGNKGYIRNNALHDLIFLDLVFITVSLIFQIPDEILYYIYLFDLIVCIFLLGEYFIGLIRAPSKMDYICDKWNILSLIASIPFDFIIYMLFPVNFPISILGYLRLLKLIRLFRLARFRFIIDLFKKTRFHMILLSMGIIIVIFTILMDIVGTSYNTFDYFYFVIVTLTTVGYGDITPVTYNEKVLTMILVLFGILMFSAITAAISSFLTDKIIDETTGDDIKELKEDFDEKSENILNELDAVRKENEELRNQITELKDIIEKK